VTSAFAVPLKGVKKGRTWEKGPRNIPDKRGRLRGWGGGKKRTHPYRLEEELPAPSIRNEREGKGGKVAEGDAETGEVKDPEGHPNSHIKRGPGGRRERKKGGGHKERHSTLS